MLMKEFEFGGVKELARSIQGQVDMGIVRVKQIHSERNGKEVKYVINVLELDKEETNNELSVKVDVDTKEANENIKELTAAANECVEAFEKLNDTMTGLGKLINKPKWVLNGTPVDTLYREKQINEWLNGSGPLPTEK
jgi:predicted transcriptional regulator